MRVQQTKERINSYINAGIVGATGGYALKYAMPLSEYEKNDTFTKEVLKKIKQTAGDAQKEEFEAIEQGAREGSEEIAENVLNIFKENKKNILSGKFDKIFEEMPDMNETTKNGVQTLIKRVQKEGENAEELARQSYEALAKSSRPVFYFVALASAVALSFAVLKNSLKTNIDYAENDNKFDIYS